jgi:hypothetical protein
LRPPYRANEGLPLSSRVLNPQLPCSFRHLSNFFLNRHVHDAPDKSRQFPRWRYGLSHAGNANFAWLQHMIYHLAPNGKIGMVLANGSLFSQSGGEGEIRRKIVEDVLVEGIVAMPTQLFYTTQIPVSLWFLSRNNKQKKARRCSSMSARLEQ